MTLVEACCAASTKWSNMDECLSRTTFSGVGFTPWSTVVGVASIRMCVKLMWGEDPVRFSLLYYWAVPRGTAIRGQPVEGARQASASLPLDKNRDNLIAVRWTAF